MADVIVYPWHGKPIRYVDGGAAHLESVSTVADPTGPLIHNKFGLPERLKDNGDGTYSTIVALATSGSDVLITENGLLQRYFLQADGTYNRVVATSTLGNADAIVTNAYGLREQYVNFGDGTYGALVDGAEIESVVYNAFGLAEGFDETGGIFVRTLSGIGDTPATYAPLYYGDAPLYYGDAPLY